MPSERRMVQERLIAFFEESFLVEEKEATDNETKDEDGKGGDQ